MRSYWQPLRVIGKGYTLIIAEKPKAAKRIAEALSYGRARKHSYKNVPFWYFTLGLNRYVVASSVGHLFTLTTDEKGFPVFNYYWAPIWEVEGRVGYAKKYYELLAVLAKYAGEYINACDYDIEGSVIGYMIIMFLGDPRRAKRMKYSSLTDDELRRAFKTLEPLDKPMIEAGLCRHELDWIWGINVSRALMKAVYKVTGRRISLSAGRVQSPTLIEVVRRERERRLHLPLPRPSVSATAIIGGEEVPLELVEPRIETLDRAKYIASQLRKQGYLVVVHREYATEKLNPPPPFNLGDLQAEASRIYGYSPLTTQRIAEQLYLDALISYPRTNSQKLPPALNFKEIMDKLYWIDNYSTLVKRLLAETHGILKPRQGPKEDPAHPAIYPTGVKPGRLDSRQWKIYDLVVRRFLAAFAKPAIIDRVKATLRGPLNTTFMLSSKSLRHPGWLFYYPFRRMEVKRIPRIGIGDRVEIHRVLVKISYTSPPKAYTKTEIVKWMESVNIGTEATRARIMETLFERKYLEARRGKVTATPLGFIVAEVLEEFFSELASVELTRRFEQYMEDIRRGLRTRNQVVSEARKTLSALLLKYNEQLEAVGLRLARGLGFRTPPQKCLLCDREAERDGLCVYHALALGKLREAYDMWYKVLNMSWRDYLVRLSKIKSTGQWIRDVVKALLDGRLAPPYTMS